MSVTNQTYLLIDDFVGAKPFEATFIKALAIAVFIVFRRRAS